MKRQRTIATRADDTTENVADDGADNVKKKRCKRYHARTGSDFQVDSLPQVQLKRKHDDSSKDEDPSSEHMDLLNPEEFKDSFNKECRTNNAIIANSIAQKLQNVGNLNVGSVVKVEWDDGNFYRGTIIGARLVDKPKPKRKCNCNFECDCICNLPLYRKWHLLSTENRQKIKPDKGIKYTILYDDGDIEKTFLEGYDTNFTQITQGNTKAPVGIRLSIKWKGVTPDLDGLYSGTVIDRWIDGGSHCMTILYDDTGQEIHSKVNDRPFWKLRAN